MQANHLGLISCFHWNDRPICYLLHMSDATKNQNHSGLVKPKVLVIGGGFAGIQFISTLDQKRFDVLLIDKLNHHQFQPLF